MNQIAIRILAAFAVACCATNAFAAEELAVYVFRNGNPAAGLSARLDGGEAKSVADDGSVFFDLTSGAHGITISDNGQILYNMRFDSAQGQNADVGITLTDGKEARATVETYFKNEAAGQRALAALGAVVGRVTSDGLPLAGAQVSALGTNVTTATDSGGNYRIELPRGVYTFEIDDAKLGRQQIEGVRVVANVERGAAFSMQPTSAGGFDTAKPVVEELVVIARAKPMDLGESERYAVNVVDTMDASELARFGGSDIAASVIRIP
ncbi:MAG: carboxypeptidase-like regulatory domain-containing protein, partial [Gammaproteobacteria bacterium]|nr:carboxypeptidase-like regulatory domain-containing protein [Gammaproteobacteria bacterium]